MNHKTRWSLLLLILLALGCKSSKEENGCKYTYFLRGEPAFFNPSQSVFMDNELVGKVERIDTVGNLSVMAFCADKRFTIPMDSDYELKDEAILIKSGFAFSGWSQNDTVELDVILPMKSSYRDTIDNIDELVKSTNKVLEEISSPP